MASGRIKGLTIEINGETTKLQKSLGEVDKKLKSTSTQLKDVNKLLKFDPKNTELLEQKQKLLADSIAATKEKLDQLKTASEQANDALASGEISQEQYDGLQREIADTEQSLKSLEDQAKNTEEAVSSIGQAGDKLQEIGGKISDVGTSMTKNVTAPIVAVGAASMAAFNEVDKGYDIVTMKTGATGEALDDLKKSMENLYSTLPVSAEEAGSAIGEVNTRFKVTGAELEALSTEFLKFARINGTDVSSSVDSVDKIMKKYGVDASKTSEVLGLMTKASQDTGISIDTLESQLEKSGAQMKEMGFGLTESVNLLAQMELNGVEASTAMAGFRKTVQNATKDGLSADEALRQTIESIKNASTETEALQIATDLFGTKGAPEMTQAIREGRISLDEISGSLSEYGGIVDQTFSDVQSSSDEQKIAFNNLKLAGSELGESIGSVLSPIIQGLSDKLRDLKDWFDGLSPSTKETIVKIALLAATIGPLLIVVGKVIAAVGTILKLLPAVKGAILAVNAAMAANPILAVISVITALIAIFALLWNNCEGFREFWIGLWEGLKSVCSDAWEAIKGFFQGAWDFITGLFSGIGSWFGERWSDITSAFSAVGEFFSGIFSGAWEGITTAFSTVSEFFESCWKAVKAPFEKAGEWFGAIFDGVKEAIKAPINFIIRAINKVIGALNSLSIDIPDWVPIVGGETWGIDIPKVPELARGGVLKKGQMALLEGAGAEAVIPLENNKAWIQATADAMSHAIGGMNNGQIVIPVYIGKERIQTIVASANTKNTFITGGH